jgi:hypothetical protein
MFAHSSHHPQPQQSYQHLHLQQHQTQQQPPPQGLSENAALAFELSDDSYTTDALPNNPTKVCKLVCERYE